MFKKSLFKSYSDDEFESNVNQTKFIQERIKLVEKYIPELGKAIFNYTDKNAKSRDCIDKLALVLDEYGKAENVTTGFKLRIRDFANVLLDVGTKQDAQIRAMETEVLEQLNEQEKQCSHLQNQLKVVVMAGDKERNWRKNLKRTRASQSQDQQQISLAETEYIKAKRESTRSWRILDEQADIFEKKRLSTIKEALLSWSLAELHFHAKALQLFTDAYRMIADINLDEDMEEFRSKLRTAEDTPRSDVFQRSDSVLQLFTLPFRKGAKFTGSGIPHPCSSQSSPRSSQLNEE